MDTLELIFLAIDALRNNLVRTTLTMLGVIIGIASVIIIVSLGQGATASIVDQFSSLGANVLTVQAGRSFRGPGSQGGTTDTLTEDNAKAIKGLPSVVALSGVVSTNKNLSYEGVSQNISITGVEASYQEIRSLTLSQGTFFGESAVNTRAKVVILGDELVEDIFGEGAQVVGEMPRIDGKSFRIVGVLKDSNQVLVPLTTAQKVLLSQTYLNSIEVMVAQSTEVETTQTDIENLLLLAHEIDDPEEADFSIRNAQEIITSISTVTGTLTAMLSGIAAISLVVGGIGIMNIMLVTVTERTKEIGLLKAIGAKKQDILSQFLIESIVVTMIGGAIGISLGIGITWIVSTVIDIAFIVKLSSIILALGVSSVVGIVFGWYPANKAAGLQPIDALRYE